MHVHLLYSTGDPSLSCLRGCLGLPEGLQGCLLLLEQSVSREGRPLYPTIESSALSAVDTCSKQHTRCAPTPLYVVLVCMAGCQLKRDQPQSMKADNYLRFTGVYVAFIGRGNAKVSASSSNCGISTVSTYFSDIACNENVCEVFF